MAQEDDAGGFELTLPLPPSASAASQPAQVLPDARQKALRLDSQKALVFTHHVDSQMFAISGRFERRFESQVLDGAEQHHSHGQGYKDFGQAADDLDSVVSLVWVSGTPSLQIPNLLTIAATLAIYLPELPFSPKKAFSLLHKLDLAFVSLLQGVNAESRVSMPNALSRRMTMTEKVRLRGIVESTRIAVVNAVNKWYSSANGVVDDSTEDDSQMTETDDDVVNNTYERRDYSDWRMDTARVYEQTMDELGQTMSEELVSMPVDSSSEILPCG